MGDARRYRAKPGQRYALTDRHASYCQGSMFAAISFILTRVLLKHSFSTPLLVIMGFPLVGLARMGLIPFQ